MYHPGDSKNPKVTSGEDRDNALAWSCPPLPPRQVQDFEVWIDHRLTLLRARYALFETTASNQQFFRRGH